MENRAAAFLSCQRVPSSCCSVCSTCRALTTGPSPKQWVQHPMRSLFVGRDKSPDHGAALCAMLSATVSNLIPPAHRFSLKRRVLVWLGLLAMVEEEVPLVVDILFQFLTRLSVIVHSAGPVRSLHIL